MTAPARQYGQGRAYFAKLSDAQLDAFVTARAASLNPGRGGRPIGVMQREILQALQAAPMSVRGVFETVTLTTLEATIDALAGLLARNLIEAADGQWRRRAA